MPRFAANLSFLFAERPLVQRFGAAAAAGFEAVELQSAEDLAPSVMRAEIESRPDHARDQHRPRAPSDGASGIAAVPGRESEFGAVFKRTLDIATAIGGRQIHVLAGVVPDGQRAAAERTFIANLARAADAARDAGMTILIEPINLRDRPGYVLTHAEQAADIIARVDRPNVRMQFDFYHAQIMGGDVIRRFETHRPWIGHIQIAAVPSRAEPDEGEVRYEAIFDAIDRLGWAGYVGCEYQPRASTEAGLGWALAYGLRLRAR